MPRIKLDGDARNAVKAHQDLDKAIDSVAKSAGESEKKLNAQDRAARRIKEAVDPHQRYNRQLGETAKLASKGAISIDDARKRAEMLRRRLDGVGRSGGGAFGSVQKQVVATVASMVSLQAAIALVKKGLQEVEQVGQQAADSVVNSLSAQGEIQQLSPTKRKQVNAFAKQLIQEGVFSSDQRTQAFKTSFNLESAGFSERDKQFLLGVGKSRFVGPESLTDFGGRLKKAQDIFGKDDAGSLEQVLDKTVVAAATTQSDASTIAGRIPEFAGEAKALRFSYEEALSAFVKVEQASANPEQAATRFKSLLSRLDKSDLAVNSDLTDTLDSIQARIDKGEKASDIVPDIRGLAALRALLDARKTGGITQLEKEITDSEGTFRRQGNGLAAEDPVFALGLGVTSQQGELTAFRESSLRTQKELAFQIAEAVVRQNAERQGGGVLGFLVGLGLSATDLTGFERPLIKDVATDPNSELTDANRELLLDYLRRTAEGIESQNSAPSTPLRPQ